MPELSVAPQQPEDEPKLDSFVRRYETWAYGRVLFALAGSIPKAQASTKSLAPFRSAGKLFYDTFGGTPDWCTASFTDDPQILLTAAHCVHPASRSLGFFPNIHFTRAYQPGSGEDFSIAAVAVLNAWFSGGTVQDRYDYAFLLTTAKSTVSPFVHSSTAATTWTAIAYPDQIIEQGVPRSFGGNTMFDAVGSAGRSPPPGMILMLGTPLQKGASGGPWAVPVTAGAASYSVISVASVIPTGVQNALLGPVFDGDTKKLFDRVKARCVKNE